VVVRSGVKVHTHDTLLCVLLVSVFFSTDRDLELSWSHFQGLLPDVHKRDLRPRNISLGIRP